MRKSTFLPYDDEPKIKKKMKPSVFGQLFILYALNIV
jgi:hypothetical protein